jgi:hypothetical protein
LENQLTSITQIRNAIAGQILNILESAAFGNSQAHSGFHASSQQTASINGLVGQAQGLLKQASHLAPTR